MVKRNRNVVLSDDEEDTRATAPEPAASASTRSAPTQPTKAVADLFDDDVDDDDVLMPPPTRLDKGKGRALPEPEITPATAAAAGQRKSKRKHQAVGDDGAFAWEAEYQRSWDVVREDEQGSLAGAVNDYLERARRRRNLRDTSSIQRGIIRHLYLVLDLSLSMADRDMRPSRLELSLQYTRAFINEFFDQNPISQMAIIGTRNGIAERISPLSSNPVDHENALKSKSKLEPNGEPSLQNALEMARLGMKEVLVIFSSLTTTDPTNIHSTIDALVQDRVRVNIVGLSAEISVCREICRRTKGKFSVAMDEAHFKDLLFEVVPPQPTEEGGHTVGGSTSSASNPGPKADLMQMGFPMMQASQLPVLCACHSKLKYNGFICPRCKSKVCEIPTECPVCSLSIVSSPHLARSYRHLFPVPNYLEVNGCVDCTRGRTDARRPVADPSKLKSGCFACGTPFSTTTTLDGEPEPTSGIASSRTSSNARYECPKCHQHFCLDCDVFTHDVLGVCSGCGGSA